MRRFLFALCLIAVVGSGCAVGVRQPATTSGRDGATLHGNVLSTTGGAGKYFIEYSERPYRANATTKRTPAKDVEFVANELQPVSEPIEGLRPGRAQYYAVCAEDSENPGDPFCSPFQSFRTDGDSVSGSAVTDVLEGYDLDAGISFEVGSGPLGEDLSGFVLEYTFSGRGFLGTPRCFVVDGNRAVIGVEWDDPSLPYRSGWEVVEDGGATGPDKIGFVTNPLPYPPTVCTPVRHSSGNRSVATSS